jgi:hypothetical protein
MRKNKMSNLTYVLNFLETKVERLQRDADNGWNDAPLQNFSLILNVMTEMYSGLDKISEADDLNCLSDAMYEARLTHDKIRKECILTHEYAKKGK